MAKARAKAAKKSAAKKSAKHAKAAPKHAKTAPKHAKASAKPAAPKKAAAIDTTSAKKGDASSAAATFTRIAAKYPALADGEIAAFEALHSDAQCDEIGKRTKASEVRDEAARWAVIMDGALRAYPGALAAYSAKRFAFFLATGTQLAAVIDDGDGARAKTDGVKTAADGARAAARKAREATIERMQTFAGGRDQERADLATAIGDASTNDGLVRSLRSLAHLETAWLERIDPISIVLAENAGLTAVDAQALRAYAQSLSAKNVDAALVGALRVQDTPEMNRLEGRIILEMREARRIFNNAADRNGVVPRLEGKGRFKSLFGGHPRAAGQAPPPPAPEPEEPPPPEPPAAPAPTTTA